MFSAEVDNESFSMYLVSHDPKKFTLYVDSNLEAFEFSFYDIVEFLLTFSKKLSIKGKSVQLSVAINTDLTYNVTFNDTLHQVNLDQKSVLRYLLHIFQSCTLTQ